MVEDFQHGKFAYILRIAQCFIENPLRRAGRILDVQIASKMNPTVFLIQNRIKFNASGDQDSGSLFGKILPESKKQSPDFIIADTFFIRILTAFLHETASQNSFTKHFRSHLHSKRS